MLGLKLTGTAGLVKGFTFTLPEGAQAVVGRSRSCGISLHAVGKGREDHAFRAISRRHASVRLLPGGQVEIVDQSRHGTFVDGERIETVVLTDLAVRPHVLKLGKTDTFRLELEKP